MKSILKKVIKVLKILVLSVVLLCAAAICVKIFFLTVMPSDVFWSESESLDSAYINQLGKSKGKDFKILLFSDIQLGTNPIKDNKTLDMMDELVGETAPDFIMTAGDNSYFIFADIMTKKIIKHLDGYDIPWSTTIGNHDSDGLSNRNWLGNQYENGKNSLFKMGPANIHGVGNYVINITDQDEKVIYSLIVLDSNNKRKYADSSDYDFIYYDQIKWYEWVISEQKDTPSMLFFHIPLPEFADAAALYEAGQLEDEMALGENREAVCPAPVNSGLFDKVVKGGSTSHIFVGHDHINSLSVNYKGVQLTYGLKTGPTCYYDEDMQGATLITIVDGTNEVIVEHIYK